MEEPDFLPVEEAFQFTYELLPGGVRLHWQIAPGYYLYKERFTAKQANIRLNLDQATFSKEGEPKDDPNFGRVHVYHHDVYFDLPIEFGEEDASEITVSYQGCAEAGLCYPPQKQQVLVTRQ